MLRMRRRRTRVLLVGSGGGKMIGFGPCMTDHMADVTIVWGSDWSWVCRWVGLSICCWSVCDWPIWRLELVPGLGTGGREAWLLLGFELFLFSRRVRSLEWTLACLYSKSFPIQNWSGSSKRRNVIKRSFIPFLLVWPGKPSLANVTWEGFLSRMCPSNKN